MSLAQATSSAPALTIRVVNMACSADFQIMRDKFYLPLREETLALNVDCDSRFGDRRALDHQLHCTMRHRQLGTGFGAFFAEQDGDPVGYLQAVAGRIPNQRDLGAVESLYVLPSARRCGVGRDLLRHAAHHIKTYPARAAVLSVAVKNTPAKTLYRSEGWHVGLPDFVRRGFGAPPRGCQFMYKDLG